MPKGNRAQLVLMALRAQKEQRVPKGNKENKVLRVKMDQRVSVDKEVKQALLDSKAQLALVVRRVPLVHAELQV